MKRGKGDQIERRILPLVIITLFLRQTINDTLESTGSRSCCQSGFKHFSWRSIVPSAVEEKGAVNRAVLKEMEKWKLEEKRREGSEYCCLLSSHVNGGSVNRAAPCSLTILRFPWSTVPGFRCISVNRAALRGIVATLTMG